MTGLEVLGPHSALNVVVLEFLQPIEVMPLAFSSTALLAAVTEVIRAALGSTDCLGTSASQNSECLAQFFPMWLARKVKRSRLRYVGKHLLACEVRVDTSSIVAAGGAHSAVLNSCPGNVFLFGSNSLGQLGGVGNTQLEEIVTVSCGYGQTAVLLTDGSLYMCGQTPSDASIAGIEVEDPSAWYYRVGRFDKVSLRFKVALVSAGLDFTLLATTEGRVYGQGSNPFGALGIGTIVSTNRPVTDWTPAAIPKGTIAVNLAAGCFHSGIVDHRGWLWVAGSDLHGRLGIGRVHALECEKIPTDTVQIDVRVKLGPVFGSYRAHWNLAALMTLSVSPSVVMSSLRLVKTCQDEIQKVAPGPRWREALYQYLRHPDRHRDAIIHKSQEGFTTVYDGYPKATVHLLILPDQRIKTPQQLDRSGEFGTSFLRRVHKYAGWLIGELHKQEHLRELEFKIGIHAVPSMEPLHVHVISTDMRSNRIKHKKHWNSFTTPFFVELTQVEDILERDGHLHSILGRESHLRDDLLCNTCGRNFGSRFTKLMHHVTICSQREQLAVKRKAESEVADTQGKHRRLCG